MFAKILRIGFFGKLSLALLLLQMTWSLPVSKPSILGIYLSEEVKHP